MKKVKAKEKARVTKMKMRKKKTPHGKTPLLLPRPQSNSLDSLIWGY